MKARRDITGMRFGRLVAVESAGRLRWPSGLSYIAWKCRCDCGNEITVPTSNLTGGNSASCGCARIDYLILNKTTHGHTVNGVETAEYRTWCSILRRCNTPSDTAYKWYGARGIRVCKEWQEDFSVFLRDMGFRPSDDHSIDRWPNNKGDYEPGNCRWATRAEQARNKKSNLILKFNGRAMCATDWAREIGISPQLLHNRMSALGWSVERAISTPKRGLCRKK